MYTPEHHTVLRAIRDGSPINELPGDRFDLALQLISDGLVHWRGALTAAGTQYLSDVDEPETRRLPRPAPPKMPEGWRFDADIETWVYEGRLADCVLEGPGPDDLEADLERAEAQVALLRYLRAAQAHARAGARIGVDPVGAGVAASSQTLSGGGGESESTRPGESDLCACESAACPYAGEL